MENSRPLPIPSPEGEPFWEGLRQDKFLLQHCCDCERINWFPRAYCLQCGGDVFDWQPASGLGRLETFSVVHRAMNEAWKSEVPYVLAWVRLDEGPKLVTRLVTTDLDSLTIDAPVKVRFVDAGGGFKLPFFEQVDRAV